MEREETKGLQMEYENEDKSGTLDKMWMIPVFKDKVASVLTEYFQQGDKCWSFTDSHRVVDIVERLFFKIIDVDRLLKRNLSIDGFTFSFNVVQGVYSDELLDLLTEYHPDKWHFIQEVFMKDAVVDLVYEDRYVNSPLGCILLAQFIRRLRDLFKLSYRSIEITLSRKDFRVIFDDDTLKIDRKFSFPEHRDAFMNRCMELIVGEPYRLNVKNTKHSRSLIIKNANYELSINPDGGISYGWGVENGAHSELTVDKLKESIDVNVHCFNRAAHTFDRKGIPYVVSLLPIKENGKQADV